MNATYTRIKLNTFINYSHHYMINLYDFVVSRDFISYLSKDTTYTIFTDWERWDDTSYIHRFSFEELLQMKAHHEHWKIICIAQRLNHEDIRAIDNILQESCTWISCNPWIMSIIEKNHPEYNDILPMLERWYIIKEPINKEDLIWAINEQSYVRVFDIPIPNKLSTLQRDHGIAYLSWSKTQTHFTVLSTTSASDNVVWALHNCSKGSDNIFELYIWSQISIELSKEIVQSIKRTQRVIIIIDHKATEELWLFCDTLIKQHCGNNVIIQYIFPQFHLVSSILIDYILEEAHFDQPAIEAYIMESIESYNTHIA